MKDLKLTSTRIGAGTYKILVWDTAKWEELGTFQTHDSELHDLICDFEENDRFENQEELNRYCFNEL